MKRYGLPTLAALLLLTACTPILYDGPYEGRVVDASTGEPIEGAVVAMSWSLWSATIAGRTHRCYDSTETVTDADGYFRIKGKGLRVLSNLEEPSFIVLRRDYWPTYETSWAGEY